MGVAISIIPVVTGMDHESEKGNDKWASQPTASRVLWPLCFMLGFVSCFCMEVSNNMSVAVSSSIDECHRGTESQGLKKSELILFPILEFTLPAVDSGSTVLG